MNKSGWFDDPRHVRWIMIGLYVLCALLFGLDFVLHRHVYLDFDKIPAFYALYGFIACVVLVLLAKVMRLFLMRDEDYYDAHEPEHKDTD